MGTKLTDPDKAFESVKQIRPLQFPPIDPATLGERLPAELGKRRKRNSRRRTILSILCLLGVGMLAGACGYFVSEWHKDIAQVQSLREKLGLRNVVETDGFVRKGFDQIRLVAKVNLRSIRTVLFRPLPGLELELYSATLPQPEMRELKAEFRYDLGTRRQHPRVKPRVEFIPFAELPPELLPSKDKLIVEQEFILSPEQGVLEPGTEPVWLELPDGVHATGDRLDVSGVSLRDGWLLLLVRPVEAEAWRVPPPAEHIQVRPGLRFLAPIRLGDSANQFEIVAVVVPSQESSPFADKTELVAIPAIDLNGQPLELTKPERLVRKYDDASVAAQVERLGGRVKWHVEGVGLPAGRWVQVIDFNGCTQVSDDDLRRVLRGVPWLQVVELVRTAVTDAGVAYLASQYPALKHLNLDETAITDDSLSHLKPLRLQSLQIRNTAVTDAGLKSLEGQNSLTFLGLRGTTVTDSAIQELKAALPNCEIVQ